MDDATSTLSTWMAPRSAPGAGPRLWVTHHPEPSLVGRSISVEADGVDIGREADRHGGLFADRTLSRRHARVTRSGGQLSVEDLQSRNGTTVDGTPITRASLPEGALLGIGSIRLLVARGTDERAPGHARLKGVSPALLGVLNQVRVLAEADVTVSIVGEPGVGKELVARELHRQSGRTGPFQALNCAGVADTVLHSELFGHVRGAFSGAHQDRPGLIRQAAGGTLLLDEIGDASASFQASLLRLLQERTFRPVGADHDVAAECRIVAATNQDLDQAVARGTFRHDLYTRLSPLTVRVPPLRERRMDIPVLAHHFAVERAGPDVRFSPELSDALVTEDWPGNVRQLEGIITSLSLTRPPSPWGCPPNWSLRHASGVEQVGVSAPDRTAKVRPEPAALEQVLLAHGGNVRSVAAQLGIGRNTLYRWIHDAGLDLASVRQSSAKGEG